MARLKDRNKALQLRKKGMSYSQIKLKLGVSKSTLHYWLRDHPLSDERIRALRDWNHVRIEKFRRTMEMKRNHRQEQVLCRVNKYIGKLSKRELFIAGLFLYWAEGTKTTRYTVALTNTDPAVLKFFIKWLRIIGLDTCKIKGRLHLYSDMNPRYQTMFWSNTLGVPKDIFRRPYIKTSISNKRSNYKGRFGYGTCSLWVTGRDIDDLVTMGVKSIRNRYMPAVASRNSKR